MFKHAHHEPNPEDGFELQDVSVKIILISGVFMVVFTLGCYFVSFMFTKMLVAEDRATVSNYEAPPTAVDHNDWSTGVRLQPNPPVELAEHANAQHTASTSFEKLSESPEIYRLPINVTLDHVAKHGLPVWEAPATPATPEAQ